MIVTAERVFGRCARRVSAARRCLAGLALVLAAEAPAQQDGAAGNPEAVRVVLVPVTEATFSDTGRTRRFTDGVAEVADEGAAAVVFEIDTAGSHAFEALREVLGRVPKLPVRKIAWVNPAATGAGAAVALASDEIYVAPAGVIGALSPPVPPGAADGGERQEYRRELAVVSALARAVAGGRGHDVRLAGAMVDAEVEIEVAGEVLKRAGDTLALTAAEAVEPWGSEGAGRPLARAVVDGFAELVDGAGLAGAPVLRLDGTDYSTLQPVSQVPGVEEEPQEPAVEAAGVVVGAVEGVGEEGEADAAAAGAEPGSSGERPAAAADESLAEKVVVIPVGRDDLMSKARFEFMQRTLDRAKADAAAAVVFDLNTPGGFAWETTELMMEDLAGLGIPTIAYVNPQAQSAGALIAIACDTIYMAPSASIGSAGAITVTGEGLEGTLRQKVYSMMIAVARNTAELKGHNPDVVEAFIDEEKEVIIDGVVVSEAGKMLNLGTSEATRVLGGKPVLAKGSAAALEGVLQAEGLGGREVVRVEPLGMEKFARWVERFSAVLILIGLAGAYMEIKTPGFGVPGLVAALAFAVFFFGNNLAGKLAGYELAVLFVLGLALVAIEVFVFPGTVVPALLGGSMMVGALLFAMVDRGAFEAIGEAGSGFSLPDVAGVLRRPLINLAIGLTGSAVVFAVLMRYLPQVPYFRRLVLADAVTGQSGMGAGTQPDDQPAEVGMVGEAVTDLRPAGRARFGNEILDVTAGTVFLTAGTAVRIREADGSRVLVEAAG